MAMKTLLILGGYGGTGRYITRRLLEATDARLVVAGRHGEKADRLAEELNGRFPGRRITATAADAADLGSLRVAFRDVDLVLVCLPTIRHTEQITRAALAAGLDYLDLHYPAGVVPILRGLEPDIRKAGRCFITQAGFHPGLLAPLVKLTAPHFSRYQAAAIGLAMSGHFDSSPEAAAQFMEELGAYDDRIFARGAWRRAGWRGLRKFDFGPGFGTRICAPLWFAEMEPLPERYGLREAGCYAAGFNWLADNLLFPLGVLLGKVKRGLGAQRLGRWLMWSVNTFARPPYGVVMQLEARGEKDGQPLSVKVVLRHPDAYEFTAIAVVGCLRQYLDGAIARPGLWLMGEAVQPAALFADLGQMGVCVETGLTPAAAGPAPETAATTGLPEKGGIGK
jgi:saccharopine dehydrogenase (NAD+, L-lysine-forming)